MSEQQAKAEVRTVGFVFVSTVLHVALALGILALKAQQPPKVDVVEIQILGGDSSTAMPMVGTLPTMAAKPVSEAPKTAEQSQAPEISTKSTAQEITKEDIVAPLKAKAPEVKAQPKVVAAKPAAAKAAPAAAPKVAAVEVAKADPNAPLETADLEEPKNLSAAPEKQLNTEDFSKDLDQVDQESEVKVAALKKNLNSDADEALKDQENQTEQLKAQTAAENAALAKQIAANKAKAKAEQQALAKAEAERQAQAQSAAEQSAAAAVAAEQAQADKAASDKSAKLAAEKAQTDKVAAAKLASERVAQNKAAQERMLAAKAQADKVQSDKDAAENAALAAAAAKQAQQEAAAQAAAEKAGQGNGEGQGANGVAATDVRSLNELRQIPGNSHPIYDSEDRLKGRQGDVAFLAYISKDGTPVKFKMVQSSGHRELDAKTLRAIRSWKFYPGQEGWVEIPFRWDLKGGPQEMPARLRTQASSSTN